MLTIEYVRERYPKEYGDLSDEEVQKVLDFFYTFGHIMVDEHIKNGPNIFKNQKNNQIKE